MMANNNNNNRMKHVHSSLLVVLLLLVLTYITTVYAAADAMLMNANIINEQSGTGNTGVFIGSKIYIQFDANTNRGGVPVGQDISLTDVNAQFLVKDGQGLTAAFVSESGGSLKGKWENDFTLVLSILAGAQPLYQFTVQMKATNTIRDAVSNNVLAAGNPVSINLIDSPCKFQFNEPNPPCDDNGDTQATCVFACPLSINPEAPCPQYQCLCSFGYQGTQCSPVPVPSVAFVTITDGPDQDRVNAVVGVGDEIRIAFDGLTDGGGYLDQTTVSLAEAQAMFTMTALSSMPGVEFNCRWIEEAIPQDPIHSSSSSSSYHPMAGPMRHVFVMTVSKPYVGIVPATVTITNGARPIKAVNGTSAAWSGTASGSLSNMAGTLMPDIESVTAANTGENYGWGVGDTITIKFYEQTDRGNPTQQTIVYDTNKILTMFDLNFGAVDPELGLTSMSGEWLFCECSYDEFKISLTSVPIQVSGRAQLEKQLNVRLLSTADIRPDGAPNAPPGFSLVPVNFTGSFGNTSAAPTIVSALFQPERSEFEIRFNMYTNRASLAATETVDNCTRLLTTNTLAYLGQHPTCEWRGNDVLAVVPDSTASWPPLQPSMTLALRADAPIRSADETSPALTTLQPTLQLGAQTPQAVLGQPGSVGSCDVFRLDASQSSGYAGGALTFKWRFKGAVPATGSGPPLSGIVNTTLTSVMAAKNTSRVWLNASLLTSNYRYEFTVTVKNWLGYESSASGVTTITGQPKPSIRVQGGGVQFVRVSKPVLVPAEFTTSTCAGAAAGNTSLAWVQVTNTMVHADASLKQALAPSLASLGLVNVSNHVLSGGSLGKKSLTLIVPPFQLLPSEAFAFLATGVVEVGACRLTNIGACTDSQLNRALLVLYVVREPIRAVITGGDRDVSFTNTGGTHYLDAGQSFDPNQGGKAAFGVVSYTSGGANGLTFQWACKYADSSNDCFTGANATFLTTTTAAKLAIPQSVISPTNVLVHNFSVTVKNGPTHNATAFTLLKFNNFAFPSIWFLPFRTSPNPRSRVTLQLQFSKSLFDVPVTSFSWTVMSRNLDLNAPGVVLVKTATSLVLAPNVLQPLQKYDFRLELTRNGLKAGANVGFRTAGRACCGTCIIEPAVASFDEPREITCYGWQAIREDQPLQYSFRVINELKSTKRRPKESDVLQTLSDFSPQNVLKLPNGLPPLGTADSGRITIECNIQTANGVVHSFPIPADITSVSATINNKYNGLEAYIRQQVDVSVQDYLERGDANSVYQAVFIINSLLRYFQPAETTELQRLRKAIIKAVQSVYDAKGGSSSQSTNSLFAAITMMGNLADQPGAFDSSFRRSTMQFIETQLKWYSWNLPRDEEGGSSAVSPTDLARFIGPALETLDSALNSTLNEIRANGITAALRQELYDLTVSYQKTLRYLSALQIFGLAVSEAAQSYSSLTSGMYLASRKVLSSEVDGLEFQQSSSNNRFTLPSSLSSSLPASVSFTFSVQLGALYDFANFTGPDDVNSLLPANSEQTSSVYSNNAAVVTLEAWDVTTSDGGPSNDSSMVSVSGLTDAIRVTITHDSLTRVYVSGTQAGAQAYCQYWRTSTQSWSSDGCTLVEQQLTYTVCDCTHLTDFSVSFQDFKPGVSTLSTEDFRNITWANIQAHPTTAIGIIIVLSLYIILLPYARRKDRKNLAKYENLTAVESPKNSRNNNQLKKGPGGASSAGVRSLPMMARQTTQQQQQQDQTSTSPVVLAMTRHTNLDDDDDGGGGGGGEQKQLRRMNSDSEVDDGDDDDDDGANDYTPEQRRLMRRESVRAPKGWKVFFTDEMVPYYVNASSGETVWVNPALSQPPTTASGGGEAIELGTINRKKKNDDNDDDDLEANKVYNKNKTNMVQSTSSNYSVVTQHQPPPPAYEDVVGAGGEADVIDTGGAATTGGQPPPLTRQTTEEVDEEEMLALGYTSADVAKVKRAHNKYRHGRGGNKDEAWWRKNRFVYSFVNEFRHRHLWLSVKFHHPRDKVNSVERLSVVFCLVLGSMAFNAIFFGTNTVTADIVSALLAAIGVLLCTLFLMFLFRGATCKHTPHTKAELVAMALGIHRHKFAMRCSKIVAWCVWILMCAGFALLALVYGLQFDLKSQQDKRANDSGALTDSLSYRWIISVWLALAQDFLINRPVLIFIRTAATYMCFRALGWDV